MLLFIFSEIQQPCSVIQPSEAKFWEQVKVEFVTEESDKPEAPTVLLEHRISWRSKRKYNIAKYFHSDIDVYM